MSQINFQATQQEKDRQATKADALIAQLRQMTPQQVATYIDTNVTSLATAKPIIKALAIAVAMLAREI